MRMRTLFAAAAAALGLALMAQPSQAAYIVDASVGGAVNAPGLVTYVNFDNLSGTTLGTSSGIGVSYTGDATARTGAAAGIAAPPFLSNNNGQLFGDNTNGPDGTVYLTTGVGSVDLALPGEMRYFGLLWGSVDDHNRLDFYNGVDLVFSVSGLDVDNAANGDQGEQGTFYVNITSDEVFTRVNASSSQYAFEFDNVATASTLEPVPEPMTLAILGIGIAGIGVMRRRRA